MKRVIILISICLSHLFGASELEFSRNVSQDISAEEYETKISIQGEAKTLERIKGNFDSLLKYLKDNESICEGGEYSIYPQHRYSDNIREFIGYSGYLELQCRFKDGQKYDDSLALIDAILDKEVFSVSVLPLKPYISSSQLDNTIKILERRIILEAREYIQELNNTIGLNCTIKNIKFFSQDSSPMYATYRSEAFDSMAKTSTELPINPKKTIPLRGDFVLSCE